jgi:type I restriction enzyme S subunit
MNHKIGMPQLRFLGFDNVWKEVVLNDVAEFRKGKGISKSDIIEDGNLECIRYGELYTTYNELIVNVVSKTNLPLKGLELSVFNDVIIPASGETQLDIATASCVLKSGVALSGDLNIIRSSLNGIFLSFYLNSKKKLEIAKLAQGSSVVHLYSSQLKSLKLNVPTIPEQQKIASFLSGVDEKIQQLSRKKELLEQYKKGLMQQLFSGKLRFKDENGNDYADWEEKKLGEIAGKIGDGLHGTPTYSEDSDIYFINGNNLTNGKIEISEKTKKVDYAISTKNDKGLNKNTILISLNGTIGNIAKYNNEKVMLGKSVGYYNFKGNADFYYHLLKTETVQNFFVSELTGSTIKNLSLKTLRETIVPLPCLAEQQKIANFASSIDIKIESTNQQINQTQSFKKGLLQQMFV